MMYFTTRGGPFYFYWLLPQLFFRHWPSYCLSGDGPDNVFATGPNCVFGCCPAKTFCFRRWPRFFFSALARLFFPAPAPIIFSAFACLGNARRLVCGGQALASNVLFGAGPLFSFWRWPRMFFPALASWPQTSFFDVGPGQTSFDLV